MTYGCSRRAGRAPRLALLSALALVLVVPAVAGAIPLQQLKLPSGCLRAGGAGGCTDSGPLVGNSGQSLPMALDPINGTSLYVPTGTDGIAIFDVNQTTGAVTRRPGTAGCIAESGDGTTCAKAKGLSGIRTLTISRDGTRLVAASDATRGSTAGFEGLAIFARNPDTGQLSQTGTGTRDCVVDATASGSFNGDGCTVLNGLPFPQDLAFSKDGKHIYVASHTYNGNDAGWLADVDYDGTTPSQGASPACFVASGYGSPNGCSNTARGLFGAVTLKVSPDGNNLYVANWGNYSSDVSVVNYSIDQVSGQLTQPNGTSGCVMPAANPASCSVVPSIASETAGIAFLDDAHVYVSTRAGATITLFNRSGAFGTLTPASGTGACVTSGSAAGCTATKRLYATQRMAVTPDHKTLLAVGIYASAVTSYDLAADGTMTPVALNAGGCFVPDANSSDGCSQWAGGEALPFDVVVTPNSRFAIVSAWGSDGAPSPAAGLMVFAMDPNPPACQPAQGTTSANTIVKVKLSCSDADGDALTLQAAGPPSSGLIGTFDSAAQTVEYAPSSGFTGTATFQYTASDGIRTSAPATVTVTVTPPPPPPKPVPPKVTPRVTNQLVNYWQWPGTTTYLTTLKPTGKLPPHAKMTMRCAGKKCPFKTFKVPTKLLKNPYKALKTTKRRTFHVGEKLTVLITAPGYIGRAVIYTFVKNKQPTNRVLCTPVGSTKLRKSC